MRALRPVRALRPFAAVASGLAIWLATAARVAAHGEVPTEPPSVATILLGWTFEPLPTLTILIALCWWLWAVGRVNAAHPANPVPRRRTVYFLLAIGALSMALLSGIDRYDTTLFSIHMVQHILLILVSAPLLALAAPVTLLLRLSSSHTRRRWILPVLHSRIVRVISHPIVAFLVLASVMWVSHFSPLFDAGLEDPLIHDLEHVLFLTAALLFWWPAVAADPAPSRMGHPGRLGLVFMQMTQNTFLAVVLISATTSLYRHYETLVLPWPSDPLEDQRLAAGLMWLVGDLIFIGALMLLVRGWMRSEERDAARNDREASRDLAAIRVREQRLADRLAEDRGDRA